MIDEYNNESKWIKPLATFTAKVINGYQIEIPAAISKPLNVNPDDMIEVAYVGLDDTDEISVFNTVVGVRNRVGLKKDIAQSAKVQQGDTILVGILSVYHSRSDGLVVVFDPDALPEWFDGERD